MNLYTRCNTAYYESLLIGSNYGVPRSIFEKVSHCVESLHIVGLLNAKNGKKRVPFGEKSCPKSRSNIEFTKGVLSSKELVITSHGHKNDAVNGLMFVVIGTRLENHQELLPCKG